MNYWKNIIAWDGTYTDIIVKKYVYFLLFYFWQMFNNKYFKWKNNQFCCNSFIA